MAKVCELCGKGYLKGNLVCFSNKKSIRRTLPNLRKIKIVLGGTSKRMNVCTGCLSRKRFNAVSLKAAESTK